MAVKLDEQQEITPAKNAHSQILGLSDEMRPVPDERLIITDGKFEKDEFPELSRIDQTVIDNIYDKCTDLNILVAGVTGSGKSSLANAIVGSEDLTAFKEGTNLTHCTEHVTPTKGKNVRFLRVWDSPGLLDGTNNDSRYLKEIGNVVKLFQPGDLVVFCIETKARFIIGTGNKDLEALRKIKGKLGSKTFQNMVIALTFTDTIASRTKKEKQEEHYKTTIDNYKISVRKALENYVKLEHDLAQKIPIFPVQHQENSGDFLPDGTRWLSYFWFGCLNAIPDIVGKAKWLKYFEERVRDETDPNPDRTKLVLSDDFLPEEFIEMKKEYKAKGKMIGIIGLLGGPLMLLTIPMGIYAGRKYGKKKYIEHLLLTTRDTSAIGIN